MLQPPQGVPVKPWRRRRGSKGWYCTARRETGQPLQPLGRIWLGFPARRTPVPAPHRGVYAKCASPADESPGDENPAQPLTDPGLPALIPKELGLHPSLECRHVNETPSPTVREMEILKVLWEHG